MTKRMMTITMAAFAGALIASGAYAKPLTLTGAQMDTVAGGAFVCPVISTDAVMNSSLGGPLPGTDLDGNGGYYTIAATNTGEAVDDTAAARATNYEQAGHPAGTFAAPGDTTYSPIWYGL